MTPQAKEAFLHEYMRNVEQELHVALERTPNDWDGRELRVWIAEKFKMEAAGMLNKAEYKRFNNDVLINNL